MSDSTNYVLHPSAAPNGLDTPQNTPQPSQYGHLEEDDNQIHDPIHPSKYSATQSQEPLSTQKIGNANGNANTNAIANVNALLELEKDDLTLEIALDNNLDHSLLSKRISNNTIVSANVASLTLQLPFVRLAPLDPHMTREDASSVVLKDLDDKPGSVAKSLYMNNARLLLHLLSDQNQSDVTTAPNTPNTPQLDTKLDSENQSSDSPQLAVSPKVISYRKGSGRRQVSEGSIQYDLLKEKFDPKLYVDEKYKDLNYRYATMKRNTDFHQLFRQLDLTDRLLDDFSCALSREILLQGRLYISEGYVCFNSNLLGWVTNMFIPMDDIIWFEKKNTAGLFPNGIAIETTQNKYVFASFISRDLTFDFLKTIWEGYTGLELPEVLPQLAFSELESTEAMESYMNTIDGDDKVVNLDMIPADTDSEYSSDDAGDFTNNTEGKRETKEASLAKNGECLALIRRFKPGSGYVNNGPDKHTSTKFEPTRHPDETIIRQDVIDAPLGIVSAILFGLENLSFQIQFLEEHDASEIDPFDVFTSLDDGTKALERRYTYRKALGYSIGPKSTKCEVVERLEKLDYSKAVVFLSSIKTPDVPLGNAFTVKTRYVLTWASENRTTLEISYFIEWTGRSWIKSVIEKLAKAGQQQAADDLVTKLVKEVENVTEQTEEVVKKEQIEPEDEAEEEEAGEEKVTEVQDIVADTTTQSSPYTSFSDIVRKNVAGVFYFIVSFLVLLLVLQLQLFQVVKENNMLLKNQLLVSSKLMMAAQSMSYTAPGRAYVEQLQQVESTESLLWQWLRETKGRELNALEKVEYLTQELNLLFQEDSSKSLAFFEGIELKFKEVVEMAQDFNYLEYVDGIKQALGGGQS